MQNNIFLGGQEPLLNPTPYQNLDAQMAELQRMQQALEEQKRSMAVAQQQMQQPKSSMSPIWDEVEKITSELTDKEFQYVEQSEEFTKSQQKILGILNAEYMKMMKPIVEQSKEGSEALKEHLTLLKQLRKEAAKESEKKMELFNEYISTNPDISFKEFMNSKRKK